MNYGQTAIGEVRVIANYLGRNPWEFESPFVLRKKIMKHIYMYMILEIRYSLQILDLLKFESFFILGEK